MISRLLLLIAILLVPISRSEAATVKSRYTTLVFSDTELLHDFNDEIRLGRKLTYYLRKKKVVTVEDEILAKIDTIIEKAEVVLDMFPDKMHIRVVLLPDADAVNNVYYQMYRRKASNIAYYSLSKDTIYISVDDASLRVLAHEVGHAVVDHFFKVRPPYNVHELMAQFTEKHITD